LLPNFSMRQPYIVLSSAHWLPSFPHSNREIWVKPRQIRDLLLAIEPGAKWEKHEARRCPICRRWFLGIQAQMLREREMVARLGGRWVYPDASEISFFLLQRKRFVGQSQLTPSRFLHNRI
jgi:hypothetical protein